MSLTDEVMLDTSLEKYLTISKSLILDKTNNKKVYDLVKNILCDEQLLASYRLENHQNVVLLIQKNKEDKRIINLITEMIKNKYSFDIIEKVIKYFKELESKEKRNIIEIAVYAKSGIPLPTIKI